MVTPALCRVEKSALQNSVSRDTPNEFPIRSATQHTQDSGGFHEHVDHARPGPSGPCNLTGPPHRTPHGPCGTRTGTGRALPRRPGVGPRGVRGRGGGAGVPGGPGGNVCASRTWTGRTTSISYDSWFTGQEHSAAGSGTPPHERNPRALRGTAPPVGFKPHLRVEAIGGEAVYLLSERRHDSALHGPQRRGARPAARRHPDPGRPSSWRPPAWSTPSAAGRQIAELAEAELIGYQRTRAADAAAEAYWELAGLDGAQAALDSTSRCSSCVLGPDGPGPRPPPSAWRPRGLTVADEEASGRALARPVRRLPAHPAWPRSTRRAPGRGPALAARQAGRRRALGGAGVRAPETALLVVPGDTGCAATAPPSAGAARARPGGPVPGRRAACSPRAGAGAADRGAGGGQVGRAGCASDEQSAVCTLDTRTLRIRHHPVPAARSAPSAAIPAGGGERAAPGAPAVPSEVGARPAAATGP